MPSAPTPPQALAVTARPASARHTHSADHQPSSSLRTEFDSTPAWRVLLLHTDQAEALALAAAFAREGADVTTGADAANLTETPSTTPWDTVVCDLTLPGINLQTLAAWTTAHPHAAFLTLGPDLDPQIAVSSLQAGACAHLRRPFAPEYLVGLAKLARQKSALVRAQSRLEERTAELRQSERLLHSVLDSSEQMHLVLDADGRIEVLNQTARRLFAEMLDAAPPTGACVFDFLPPHLRANALRHFTQASEGRTIQHDAELLDRAGRLRRFIVRYSPLAADMPNLPPRVCFTAYDITARTETEAELRLRNHALSSVSQGVVIADARRIITYVNEEFTTITGFTAAESLGRNCNFLHGPSTQPDFVPSIRQALSESRPFHCEVLNYRKDGSPFWNELSITPVKNAEGVITQYVGIQRDVTERRRQRDALVASQARLQALFDHANDAFLLADDSGHYVEVNPAACRLLGRTRDQLIGLDHSLLFPPELRPWAQAAWDEFLAAGRHAGECTPLHQNGAHLHVEYTAIARIQPGLHLVILRDHSERHALQARLLHHQRLESVGRLASGVAHDLNNILTPILMAPAMLRPHVSDAGARMLLESIESGARRGSMIVRQLMTFARTQPATKVSVSLPDVLDNVATLIRETFRKDILLELVPTVSFPAGSTILGDLPQLQQALLNLALNASDAMPRGGRLVLALSHADISPAEAAREIDARPGPHAVLTVADHGTGISADHLDKIFDPFFTTKPFGQGSGLGLSVVLGVVRDFGGFVRVSSRPGVGTIFKLHFPLHLPSETAAPLPAGGSASPLPPSERTARTVLVVDDEAPVREIIRMILSRENFNILCADGADAAFSQIQSCHGRVDLVLSDLCMPGVSGAIFVERLRKRHPHLPVVILTGTDSPRDFPDSLRERVQDVLTKPFDATTLVATVRRHLQLSPAPQLADVS